MRLLCNYDGNVMAFMPRRDRAETRNGESEAHVYDLHRIIIVASQIKASMAENVASPSSASNHHQ